MTKCTGCTNVKLMQVGANYMVTPLWILDKLLYLTQAKSGGWYWQVNIISYGMDAQLQPGSQ